MAFAGKRVTDLSSTATSERCLEALLKIGLSSEVLSALGGPNDGAIKGRALSHQSYSIGLRFRSGCGSATLPGGRTPGPRSVWPRSASICWM